jgi:Transmembrane domain of unknown function (DUF3566)
LDRRTNTSDGSGRATPTVVTERDDDDLTADTDEPTQILGTASIRAAARSATAKPATAAKEASANGSPAAEENGTGADAVAAVPALPADTIGSPRDSFTFGRSASAPVSPGADDWMPAGNGASAPDVAPADAGEPVAGKSLSFADESFASEPFASEPFASEPFASEPFAAGPAVAETGTGWPADGTAFGTGAGSERAAAQSSPAQPSGGPEASTVSAAAFVWDPPEPAPTSPSSPARNFLRSSTNAKPAAPPRTPPVSVGPAKAAGSAAPAAAARPRSGKRSARQAHLTIARVEPWSVTKFSFMVSLVAFVILFVAVSVIYGTLSALGVFTSLQHVVQSLTSSQDSAGVNASKWFTASRILGWTAMLGAANIVLITAMSTIGAVVYNLTSRLIGGVEVTLRETE